VNKTVANIKQLTDDINAGKGGLGKIAHDKEFADKLQTTMNNLAALSTGWRRVKVRWDCCSKIRPSTTTAIRCWWRLASW